jgi:hypothetical protein
LSIVFFGETLIQFFSSVLFSIEATFGRECITNFHNQHQCVEENTRGTIRLIVGWVHMICHNVLQAMSTGEGWIRMVQNRNQCQDPVKTVMNSSTKYAL